MSVVFPRRLLFHKSQGNGQSAATAFGCLARAFKNGAPNWSQKWSEKGPKFGLFLVPQNGQFPMSACERRFSGIRVYKDLDKRACEIRRKVQNRVFWPLRTPIFCRLIQKASKSPRFGVFACCLEFKYSILTVLKLNR